MKQTASSLNPAKLEIRHCAICGQQLNQVHARLSPRWVYCKRNGCVEHRKTPSKTIGVVSYPAHLCGSCEKDFVVADRKEGLLRQMLQNMKARGITGRTSEPSAALRPIGSASSRRPRL